MAAYYFVKSEYRGQMVFDNPVSACWVAGCLCY